MDHFAGLVGVALRRDVLGAHLPEVQGGEDFRIGGQVIGHAGIEVAAGQRVVQALGELMSIVLVARIGCCAEAGGANQTDQAVAGIDAAVARIVVGLGLAILIERSAVIGAAGDQAIRRALGSLGQRAIISLRHAGGNAGNAAAIAGVARLPIKRAAADIFRIGIVLRVDREARQKAIVIGVFAGHFEVAAAAQEA